MRALRLALVLSFSLGLAFVASCTASESAPNFDVRVDWGLTDPTVDIPAGIDRLRLLVWIGDPDAPPEESFHTVAGLDDLDGDGNRELCPRAPDNDCTTGGLPPGEPIRITIEGQDASGRTTHLGHAGPFVLNHGERRYIDLRMYPANSVTNLMEAPLTARFLHTATALDDGRVLVTGGFTRATSMTCAASAPAGSHCFDLTAADDAFLFDPLSGRIRAVRDGMLRARGAHTATLLGDGTVLVAGGAERATLVLSPQTGGFTIDLVPGTGGDTYELFAPHANAETEDVDGDGDPGAGGFLGAAEDPSVAGRLGTARVLHAATILPGTNRVILAGGRAAPGSFTIFDLDRAGGYGVVGDAALTASRSAPSAITFGSGTNERAWIVGGARATSNAGLAEVWRAGTGSDRIGTTAAPTGFPDAAGTDRPGFSLFRPNVELISDGAFALVLGWMGPTCDAGGTTPSYAASATTLCPYDPAGALTYTVAAATGVATPTMTRNGHALGASALLGDGRVVVTGGFDSLALAARNTVELFTGDVSMGAASLSADRPMMGSPRALHTTTALEDVTAVPMVVDDVMVLVTTRRGGYMTFGGLTIAADASSVTLATGIEVVYLR